MESNVERNQKMKYEIMKCRIPWDLNSVTNKREMISSHGYQINREGRRMLSRSASAEAGTVLRGRQMKQEHPRYRR